MKTFKLLLLFLMSLNLSVAQTINDNEFKPNYKRVLVPNTNQNTLKQLSDGGIDLTCGAVFVGNQLQIELSDSELEVLNEKSIGYQVLIDDLESFYSNRSIEDLSVARSELEQMKLNTSVARSFSVNEIINNVGQHDDCDEIDWAVPVNFNLNPNPSPNSFGGCLTFDMVLQELDDMRAQYPNLISVKANASPSGQTTIEGRTVYFVRISDNPDIDEANEPETLYQSLIHSRESATVMNQLFFMWYLLENYDTDPAIRSLVNNQALYFIPVFNPDGFVYNQTISPNGGGLQRKNRNTTGGCSTFLDGVDLNRNSAYYWGNGGASTNQCSDTYLGTAPFSENETQIMRDFFLQHDFELALNHHSFKNAMLHAYAGTTITNPRPDEYSKYNHDMTEYNRYAHGPSTSISALNSGNMNDWMLGGPAGVSANGTPTGTGSGKETLAWTPENGSSAEAGATGSGFWPAPSNFVPIAKRAMRMNFLAAYFSGKYAKLHDLSQTDISSITGNFDFAVENLGQKASTFTVTVTPVSSNIVSIAGPESLSGMSVLEQRNVAVNYELDPSIQANDEIEYKVTLTNDYATDNVLYETNIKKIYNPSVLFLDNPDVSGLNNWTTSGGTWSITSDAFSGSSAITSTFSAPYSNNENKQIRLVNPINLSGASTAIIQYYAKWDLERSFDYVQIEASTNGSTWTPLCTKLTKPGAPNINNTYSGKSSTSNNFQPDGAPLYDGDTQGRWNMDEIVIDSQNNAFLLGQSTVFFRFDFKTEGSNRQDSYANVNFEGFTFDDFSIVAIELPCEASTPPSNVTVSNITSTSADVNWDVVPSATYDLRYRRIGTSSWITVSNLSTNSFTIGGLSATTNYEVQVNSKCDIASSPFSSSTNFTTTDNILSEGFFETGLDGWTDGGNDVARVQSSNSSEGLFSIRLRDNSGTASSMTSPLIDATGFDSLEMTFNYFAISMENGENFFVEFFNGSSYQVVDNFVSGSNFSNGSFFSANVTIDASSINFSSNARFRIRCDASNNNDNIYIDEVIIKGVSSGPETVPPVITLIGPSSIDLNVGEPYIEQGATATDNVDGDLTSNIVVTGSVDTAIAGVYSVDYSVSDAAGNSASVSRTVNVIADTTAPVITLIGPPSIDLNVGEAYIEQGATAIDNVDGDLTGSIVTSGSVDTAIAGVYSVDYSVSDAAGNSTSVSRTVNVIADTTAPVITLIGASLIDLNVGEAYVEQGATATDNVDGDLTGNINTSGSVNTAIAGVYIVDYSVSDTAGNSASVSRTVNVVADTTAPVIILNGDSIVNINVGSLYTELGATATDNIDGDLTGSINTTGSVDTALAGTYIINYSVNDAAGNLASEIRTVNVIEDVTSPVILLNGLSTIILELGEAYNEQGATATDNVDGDLTSSIVISGAVDINTAGTYILTYSVSDTAGNTSSIDRTVTVNPDTTAPVITLNGASVISLNVGDTYTELEATASDNIDGDLTSSIVISGTVNTNVAGTYVINYDVSDSSGNSASTSRTVNVIADTTAPVITLNGNSVIDINVGDTYTELGATAADNIDGNLTSSIITTGFVNTAVAGTYSITYSVSDAAGNSTSENRTVNVNDVPLDQILSQGFFETGLDGWIDGGNDVARVQTTASFEGLFSIRIRDNSGAASTMTSPSFNLTSFNQVNISFYFLSSGFSTGEDIILSYFNGSSWVVVQQFFANSDFFNNSFYFANVTLSNGSQNFSSNSRFRIQSDGSNNRDQAFIDQVIITGINNPAARSAGTTATMSFVKEGPSTIDLDLGLSIYPNPVTGAYLNIKSDESSVINYRIYDILGKTVLKGKTTNRIDVSQLSKGIYVIDLNDGTTVLKQKFVKD